MTQSICCFWKNATSFHLLHKRSQHLEEIRKFQHQLYKTSLTIFFSPSSLRQYIILGALAGRNTASSHCVDKVLLNRAGSPSETRLFGAIEETEDNGQ